MNIIKDDPLVGTEIGGYTLMGVLGRGGMGIVYRAEDDLGRPLALKVMAPELIRSDEFKERFMRESQSVIDHPNVIPIYEASRDQDLLYIAMKLVEGPDLKTLIQKEGRLLPARTIEICSQAAGALDAAHESGIVHRDVKPQNILIEAAEDTGGREHVYLTDFGLVKRIASQSSFTDSTYLIGSVQYMSPEQIEGKDVDGRSDVYALGCVLYECLTGSVPFDKDTEVAVLFSHLNEDPPSVTRKVPVLADSVDGVIAKAMAKSPDDRFLTAGEFADALRKELGMSGGKVRSVWAPGTMGTSGRRRVLGVARAAASPTPAQARWRSWIAAGAAALLSLGLGAALAQTSHPEGVSGALEDAATLVEDVGDSLGAIVPGGDDGRTRVADRVAPRDGPQKSRRTIARQVHRGPYEVGAAPRDKGLVAGAERDASGSVGQRAADAALSADPSRIVFHVTGRYWEGYSALYTMRRDGSGTRLLYNSPDPDRDAAWSPDRSLVAFVRAGNIWVIEKDGDGLRQITRGPGVAREPSWSPDGTKLVYSYSAVGDWDLYTTAVYGTDAGIGKQLTSGDAIDRDPSWSPSGSEIAFTRGPRFERRVYLVDADGSQLRAMNSGSRAETMQPRWSPDGRSLVYVFSGDQERLEVREIAKGVTHRIRCQGLCHTPAWSPQGGHILYTDQQNGNKDWHLYVAGVSSDTRPTIVARRVTQDTKGDWR